MIAAFGPLNSRKEANAHTLLDRNAENIRIDFSNFDDHNCTISLEDLADPNGPKPWPPARLIGKTNNYNTAIFLTFPTIIHLGETTFSARIGPTGGKRGYTKITGLPSWGIAWYLNDLLIPEITVERGQTYLFIVEGGDDSSNPAR